MPSAMEGVSGRVGGTLCLPGSNAAEWEGLSHGDVCVEDHL